MGRQRVNNANNLDWELTEIRVASAAAYDSELLS